jgi:hypothetical protein
MDGNHGNSFLTTLQKKQHSDWKLNPESYGKKRTMVCLLNVQQVKKPWKPDCISERAVGKSPSAYNNCR